MKQLKILVIIPAFNESENIENVIKHLQEACPNVDYLVVNDCSKDNTVDILRNMDANFINLPVNLGIGGAVQAGYIYAMDHDYDVAIQMDGDGQHNPEYIDQLVEPIQRGEADSVIGSRFINNEGFQSSGLRRFGIGFLSHLIWMTCGLRVYDVTSGFRAVNKEYIRYFALEYAQDYPEPEAIVTSKLQGARIKEVPVIMSERMGGTSSISGLKTAYYMIKVSISVLITRLTVARRKV